MKTILYILGALQMAGGVLFAAEAASAIHQILAAVSFGLGTICLGLAAVVSRLEKLLPSSQTVPQKESIDLTGTKAGAGRGPKPPSPL